jgi:hypothetical protein
MVIATMALVVYLLVVIGLGFWIRGGLHDDD